MGCSLGRLTIGLYFYLSGSVLVKIESQWYSAETQWDLTPGVYTKNLSSLEFFA